LFKFCSLNLEKTLKNDPSKISENLNEEVDILQEFIMLSIVADFYNQAYDWIHQNKEKFKKQIDQLVEN
jgi:hypothetical protein